MFQIYWRSVITGATGHGESEFSKEQAEQIVEQLNRENKDVLVHWYQAAEHRVHLTDGGLAQTDSSTQSPAISR